MPGWKLEARVERDMQSAYLRLPYAETAGDDVWRIAGGDSEAATSAAMAD